MDDGRAVLGQFLNLLALYSKDDLLSNMEQSTLLTRDFEIRYLHNNSTVSFVKIVFNNDYTVAIMDAEDGCPYRVEIAKEDCLFKIKSYKFLCQGCFGEDKTCNVCGGDGWGVL